MNDSQISQVFEQFLSNDFKNFKKKIHSEEELLLLAEKIKERLKSDIEEFLIQLLNFGFNKGNFNKALDWNIGSTVQHFDAETVISAFKKTGSHERFIKSIGLSWVFGQFKIKDEYIIHFLYECVEKSPNSECWWRASFSLENLEQEDAIGFLKKSIKRSGVKPLNTYLTNLKDKKSIIGILLQCNNDNIRNHIYPIVKKCFIQSNDVEEVTNCIWLLGRLKLIDKDILGKVNQIINDNNSGYELLYYTFFSIQNVGHIELRETFLELVRHEDALLRRMAVRGLSYLEHSGNRKVFEDLLLFENKDLVISEISEALYRTINPIKKEEAKLLNRFKDVENGLIVDDSDKWYASPHIYDTFSFSEDPENICFNLILDKLLSHKKDIRNPIDLATGTGRALRYFIERLNFKGTFFGVDRSQEMIKFLKSNINRSHSYIYDVRLVESEIINLNLGIKSDFIVSSFGFPSKISNKELAYQELAIVYEHLYNDGLFITFGWDETFNDGLNYYWYKHIPDSIQAEDFETWRKKRIENISSPRNCNLDWFKKGIKVPLLFNNVKESVRIMSYLFGKDAANDIISNNRKEWSMSLGITFNTKEQIGQILINKGII